MKYFRVKQTHNGITGSQLMTEEELIVWLKKNNIVDLLNQGITVSISVAKKSPIMKLS